MRRGSGPVSIAEQHSMKTFREAIRSEAFTIAAGLTLQSGSGDGSFDAAATGGNGQMAEDKP